MTVIYAEKPDLGRKIASAIADGGKVTHKDGYLELSYNSEPTVVTWGFGHMYGLQNAADYDETLKAWDLSRYPFFPSEYRIKSYVDKGGSKQLKIVNDLLKKATLIVNAADADREGELIFSYVLQGAGLLGKKPVKRLWLHSYVPADIKASYDTMKDGKEMTQLEQAARARAISDWLIGVNITIYSTKAFRDPNDESRQPISIGRVQTPTLAMLVSRELAIRNFVSKPFWNLKATFTGRNGSYEAQLDGDAFQSKEDAQALYDAILGQQGTVEDIQTEAETVSPPKLYSLATLQKEANKRYGMTAQETLNIAQELYEKQLTTYPRTDSCCLPESMKSTVTKTLNALAKRPEYSGYLSGITYVPFTKRHFNDKEVESHFALVPTGEPAPPSLTDAQKKVYDLIVLSLIRIVYPPARFEKTAVITDVKGNKFKSSGKKVLDLGWMAVDAAPDKESIIPALTVGEVVNSELRIDEGQTKPPSRYNDGSLITAMKNAGKDIDDDDLKEQIKTCGIGTQATRAGIIEKLIVRGYAERVKKNIVPTEKGIYIIQTLPIETLKSPELTGQMENRLHDIELGKETASSVVSALVTQITEWCDQLRPIAMSTPSAPRYTGSGSSSEVIPCPLCGRPMNMRNPTFVGCSGYKDTEKPCKFSLNRTVCGKKLTDAQLKKLLSRKAVKVSGMTSKAGKPFDATLSLDETGKLKFAFD